MLNPFPLCIGLYMTPSIMHKSRNYDNYEVFFRCLCCSINDIHFNRWQREKSRVRWESGKCFEYFMVDLKLFTSIFPLVAFFHAIVDWGEFENSVTKLAVWRSQFIKLGRQHEIYFDFGNSSFTKLTNYPEEAIFKYFFMQKEISMLEKWKLPENFNVDLISLLLLA